MPLNEAETKAKLIEPKLKTAGWTEENIEREYRIKSDRFYVKGEEYEIIPAKDKYADYVLKVNNVIVAVVEAKAESKTDSVDRFPSPEELYQIYRDGNR